jgi:biotin carboxyl carrier protein
MSPRRRRHAPIQSEATSGKISRRLKRSDEVAEEIVEAPAPGKILKVFAEVGQVVAEGDRLCLMEALKMELPIVAPVAGTVKAIPVAAGQTVEAGDPLAVIEG